MEAMGAAEFIEVLRREGALMAAVAEKAGITAGVPTCPDWQVSDLVRHLGGRFRGGAADDPRAAGW
jgi:hypothetical protein